MSLVIQQKFQNTVSIVIQQKFQNTVSIVIQQKFQNTVSHRLMLTMLQGVMMRHRPDRSILVSVVCSCFRQMIPYRPGMQWTSGRSSATFWSGTTIDLAGHCLHRVARRTVLYLRSFSLVVEKQLGAAMVSQRSSRTHGPRRITLTVILVSCGQARQSSTFGTRLPVPRQSPLLWMRLTRCPGRTWGVPERLLPRALDLSRGEAS